MNCSEYALMGHLCVCEFVPDVLMTMSDHRDAHFLCDKHKKKTDLTNKIETQRHIRGYVPSDQFVA